MNERVRQLAERARGTRKYVPPVWQFFDDELEKFVELVVLDCARVMDELNEAYGAPSTAGEFIRRYYGTKA